MKKIIVASKNPVKINSVKEWFEKMFPNEVFEIEGVSVPSNVSDQPMTNRETLDWAFNRANNAKNDFPNADFWVWVEWGLERLWDEMDAFAWVVVRSDITKWGLWKARTSTFFLPQKVVELINQWKELWEADDIVFWHTNSKQKNWAVGILTWDVIDRTKYYTEAVILSLIPFKNKDLF